MCGYDNIAAHTYLLKVKMDSDLFRTIKNNPQYNPNNSVAWFRKNVTNTLRNIGQQQFMAQQQLKQTTKITPGLLYFFGYDPKYKDELPYYDRFPLILPFWTDSTHFMGLNLHYLPLDKRVIILDKLVVFAQNKNQPENMKIKLSWEMLTSISEHKAVSFSVKKYLKSHVKTNFIEVPMQDWPIACFLPLARFEKANEATIWRNSR